MPLTRADADKLSRILGMAGSMHEGEALNALRAANSFIRDRGVQWRDVIATGQPVLAQPRPATPPSPPPWHPTPPPLADVLADWPQHWREAVALCLKPPFCKGLNSWERNFLATLRDWPSEISAKQGAALRQIAARAAA